MKINFMGDVMFGELLETYRNGLIATLDRTGADPFAKIRSVLDEGDLNVINLECVLSDDSTLEAPFSRILISPTRYIRFLVDNRINVVNTANNHALDHGIAAFDRSCELLRHHGITIMGYDSGRFFQEDPVVCHTQGRSVGFLGYNISNFPDRDKAAVVERVLGAVARARGAVDTVVVSIHWGEEYSHIPPPYVVAFGKRIVDAGCDIIHGHHSHQIQGIHNDGKHVFAPSLGNFIFDQKIRENRITGVLQVGVQADGLVHRLIPCRMNDHYQPEPAPQAAEYLKQLDAYLQECLQDTQGDKYAADIAARVHAGHNRNRVRMRAMMLAHFWDYLPHARRVLGVRQSRKKIFSVIDSVKSLPDN